MKGGEWPSPQSICLQGATGDIWHLELKVWGTEQWTRGWEPWTLALSLSLTISARLIHLPGSQFLHVKKKKKKEWTQTSFWPLQPYFCLKTGNFKSHSARWGKSFSLTKLVTINKNFDLSLDPLFHHQIISFLPQCQKAHDRGSKCRSWV